MYPDSSMEEDYSEAELPPEPPEEPPKEPEPEPPKEPEPEPPKEPEPEPPKEPEEPPKEPETKPVRKKVKKNTKKKRKNVEEAVNDTDIPMGFFEVPVPGWLEGSMSKTIKNNKKIKNVIFECSENPSVSA